MLIIKFKVLDSGSSGNCYILENDKEALIIEAGLPFKEVKKALDFNVKKIVGVIVGHIHFDHFKYMGQFKAAGIQTLCFGEEMPEYDAEKMKHYLLGMGKFRIKPFPLVHDVPCYGFYISHPDMGNLVYASDTEYIKYRFKGLNHILVEANYSKDLVSDIPEKRKHVLTGHMEIDTACGFIKANRNAALRSVILLHLSKESCNQEDFKAKTEKVVDCPVYVAKPGMEIEIGLPF